MGFQEKVYFPLITKHRKIDLFYQIQSAIRSLYFGHRITPVFILDEIHMVPNSLLEDLRLIFNFNMDFENPFVLILARQPFIRSKLSLSINHPLRQCILLKHFRGSFLKEELGDYLNSKLIFADIGLFMGLLMVFLA